MREILFWLIVFPFVAAFIIGFMSYDLNEIATPSDKHAA